MQLRPKVNTNGTDRSEFIVDLTGQTGQTGFIYLRASNIKDMQQQQNPLRIHT
jgi:hypothetical protein